MKPYVTQWGMDPIWSSEKTKPIPLPRHFTRQKESKLNLSLDELRDGSGKPYPVVDVVGHAVEFDEERKLWYCDIDIDTGDSYYPFVRLALARFQPNSINNCHLSRVVLAEFAQLAPDRVAAVTIDGPTVINDVTAQGPAAAKKIKVMVSGIFGRNKQAMYQPGDDPLNHPGKLENARVLMATVEKKGIGGDLGWKPASAQLTNVQLKATKLVDAKMIWMAEMMLPSDAVEAMGTGTYRVLIKEYEMLQTDPDVKQQTINGVPMRSRMVYADMVEL
jgi:hypothetical protein